MNPKKKLVFYLPILFALILIIGIFLGYKLTPVSTYNQKLFNLNLNKYDKLKDVVNYVVQEYVDSVNKNEIAEDGIVGILKSLDPHSQYITAEEFHDVNDPLLGNFEGIGIQFRIEKDTIAVIHTISGGPSEKVGLMPGDRIVKVGDSLIAGVKITNKEAMRKLKGERGTKVKVSIYRRGISDLLDFIIVRDLIPTYCIDIAYMPSETIGYIKVSKFSATTYDEFLKAAMDLEDQGMQNLILDLRGNAGGYLQAAIDMADEFLREDKLIVYTQGKNQPKELFYATDKGRLEDKSVIILIDEGSASASEIVAGAIQDNDRGLIVGRRSFGKGLVQRQLDFPDGSALRLTVARYYTPTGRCIQKPYDKENGFEDYYTESYYRFLNGEMEEPDSIHFNDSLKFITPGGKIVYGGGGIMPDIYVSVKSDDNSEYFNKLLNKSLIFQFAFNYTDKNRNCLNKFTSFEDFNKDFYITDDIFNEFVEFAEKNGVEKDTTGTKKSKEKTKILLKAFIGRNLLDDKGFYPIYHKTDKTFQEAMELLKAT
ncbi:MAG: PDZ domain-containing protein [Bacteroidetes bacterium]|nr:PDZ domain-containing protein [Bacteroidota bacterium]MBL7104849.1 PDZ domain-containing protein [Bacteroidales bacterium]